MPPQTNQPFQPYNEPPVPTGQAASAKKSHGLGLMLALILFVLLFLGAAGFGAWAYFSQQDYKNNSDKKAAAAAELAVQANSTKKDNEFTEREKSPLKIYQGPAEFGSLNISYPKTWSAYIVEADKASTSVNGYFHPGFVPDVQGKTAFALRVEITSQTYDQELKQLEGKVKSGKVVVTPFVAKNVPGVTGSRVSGEINTGQKNTMVLLPLRDKTIKISTESDQYLGDFDSIILANLKFIP